jgi:hypothetical protein
MLDVVVFVSIVAIACISLAFSLTAVVDVPIKNPNLLYNHYHVTILPSHLHVGL